MRWSALTAAPWLKEVLVRCPVHIDSAPIGLHHGATLSSWEEAMLGLGRGKTEKGRSPFLRASLSH